MISICVVTFNRENSLENCIKSISNQTFKDFECIIINNGRKLTSKTLQHIQDDRFRIIEANSNLGLAKARNLVIQKSNKKYYTFLDDDDMWDENFLEEMVTAAEKRNRPDSCFIGSTEHKTYTIIPNFNSNNLKTIKDFIKLGFTPPVGSQFYFTEHLKNSNYNHNIKSGIDHDLWFRLAKFNLKVCPVPNAISIPNQENSDDRITTNFNQRRKHLSETIEAWAKEFKSDFEPKFFNEIRSAYMDYVNFRSLLSSINNKKYLKAMMLSKNISKLYLVQEISFLIYLKLKVQFFKDKPQLNLRRTLPILC